MPARICPKCGRMYKGLALFCSRCGVELEKDKNRCSEGTTRLCVESALEDDDIYCRYCGALTTFAKERQEKGEIL